MTITALRERRDDVLPLAMRLLEMRTPAGRRIPALSADAAQLLLSYAWPGNIRELDNLLQRASIISNGPVIDAPHLRFEGVREIQSIRAVAPVTELDRELRGTLRAAEKQILLTALRAGASRREVAERLGISPRTLRYKVAQLRSAGVDVPAA
jgi:two-component system response regulator FlrC